MNTDAFETEGDDVTRTVLTPYDTGLRAEPKVWPTPTRISLARSAPIARELDEDRFGRVDFDDENGESLFTVWVERNEQGARVVHIQQLGPEPVAIRIHGEGDR